MPIEELIGSYVKLEKAGRSYKARCPFHNEKTASFFVSPDRGGYYCFGCGAKGDIFSFVEQFEGLDFRGALKVLAERTGVQLVLDQKADGEKDRLFKITEEAALYFEEQYSKSTVAKEYINSRGISPETRQAFRIGWAPEGWQNLFDYLKKKGWSETFIEKAGLIKQRDSSSFAIKNESGPNTSAAPAGGGSVSTFSKKNEETLPQPRGRGVSYYDRFRGRIIFPITDSSGRVVAFTGRILKDDGKSAKYLNSPETPLFNKSQILFGLDKAKSEIRRVGYSILVEGQMDLVLSHQCGIKNAIAASGTALTDQASDQSGVVSNLGLVRRLIPNMIIALDSDKAGRLAAMRAVAATALSMGMSVKIADIEGGKDPADLILKNPDDWKNVLKNAKHVIEYELGNILKETSDPHKLGKAVKDRLFPFLSKIDSEMDKAYFIKIIGEQTRLNEQSVWDDLRKFEKTNKTSQSTIKNESPVNLRSPLSSAVNNQESIINNSSSLKASQSLNGQKITNNQAPRIDLVERRMFGLLALMESVKDSGAEKVREEIKKIAGKSYEERINRIKPFLSDLSFEAETFYGSEKERWDVHMKELVANFEEDMINQELIVTMGELRQAEKGGDHAKVAELAKKCQVLSIRKAEVGKKVRV